MAQVASPLGLDVTEAAVGIIRVANEHMAQALRVISVQRGIDPRGFTLVSFGGAGGLHVCALANALGMHRAMVPVHAGVLSALGMLVAPRARQLSQTAAGMLRELTGERLEGLFRDLEARGREALMEEGLAAADIHVGRALDLRYQGQSYALTVPWQGLEQTQRRFHDAHEERYGHRLALEVECVNARVTVQGPTPTIRWAAPQGRDIDAALIKTTRLHGIDTEAPVYDRGRLPVGHSLTGPALIIEALSTTYLAPGWRGAVDPHGNLLLERVLS